MFDDCAIVLCPPEFDEGNDVKLGFVWLDKNNVERRSVVSVSLSGSADTQLCISLLRDTVTSKMEKEPQSE